ncbi:MAG: DUF4190 domain-containing protein [Bacteroidota bacterium]|nr:DUF4190 domain-containing protein [Bacteroidota bacterium]
MKNLIYSFFLIAISVLCFVSCASEKQLSSRDFSKRKYTNGIHISLKNHFSNSFISSKESLINTENLTSQTDVNKFTHVDRQAVLKSKSRLQYKTIKQVIKVGEEHKNYSLHLTKENPNKDSVEIITTSGRVYRGVVVKSDFDGYFIKLSPEREIYVSNFEIKRLTVLSSSPNNQPNKTLKTSSPSQDYFEDDSPEEQTYDEDLTYEEKKVEPMAILSLIFGVLGFVPIPVIGGLGWIAALVLAKQSLKKIERNPEKFKGRGLAIAGRVLGIIGITLELLALLIFILFLALLF